MGWPAALRRAGRMSAGAAAAIGGASPAPRLISAACPDESAGARRGAWPPCCSPARRSPGSAPPCCVRPIRHRSSPTWACRARSIAKVGAACTPSAVQHSVRAGIDAIAGTRLDATPKSAGKSNTTPRPAGGAPHRGIGIASRARREARNGTTMQATAGHGSSNMAVRPRPHRRSLRRRPRRSSDCDPASRPRPARRACGGCRRAARRPSRRGHGRGSPRGAARRACGAPPSPWSGRGRSCRPAPGCRRG